MASIQQYEAFKFVYEQEEKRFTELLNRGKLFFTIISFYAGVLLFNSKSTIADLSQSDLVFYLGAIILFILALLFNILALGVYKYENVCDLEVVIDSFGEKPPEDSEFLDGRLIDFTVAVKYNKVQNNKRAKFLFVTSIFILLAIICHSIFFIKPLIIAS